MERSNPFFQVVRHVISIDRRRVNSDQPIFFTAFEQDRLLAELPGQLKDDTDAGKLVLLYDFFGGRHILI